MDAVNTLPVRDMAQSTTGCCPPFERTDWDNKTFRFNEKPFIKFKTLSFLHIPLNMNLQMRKAMAKVDAADASSPDYLMLSDEVSPWHAEHYIAVTKAVPGAQMVDLSGTYLTKVFEGPFKDMREWHGQLTRYVQAKGKTPVKTYFSYTMCPRCAKAYGHNFVVGFAQVNAQGDST